MLSNRKYRVREHCYKANERREFLRFQDCNDCEMLPGAFGSFSHAKLGCKTVRCYMPSLRPVMAISGSLRLAALSA
jgi:hypothetical protein